MISHGDTEAGFVDVPPPPPWGGRGEFHNAYLRGLRVSVANKR